MKTVTSLGQLIRSRREELRYSREKLAELCDISDKCISNIELDISIPKADTLCILCQVLKINIGELDAVRFREGHSDEVYVSLH